MLGRVVDEAAERFGDASAFVASSGWSLSYRRLARASDAVALRLLEAGVGEGDVVALVLPAIPEYVVWYAAAAKIGAVTAGVNTRLAAPARDAVLERAAPAVVVTTPELAPPVSTAPGASRIVLTPATTAEDLPDGPERPPPLDEDPERPVAIVFTSGTTGIPKGAVFAGRQLSFITRVDTGGRWGGGGRQLAGTSFAHLGPMTKLAGNLRRGGTSFLMSRWQAGEALELTERHRFSTVAGIPTQVALMLRDPSFDRRDLSCVQAVVMGGGPATAALVREARRRFGAPVAVRYACTEAGIGLGTAFDDPPLDAEVSVGRPHAGVTLELLDEDGEQVGPGEVGEVCLRSPAVMSGYWRDPVATAEAFTASGAVRTGDLGHLDEAGRLRLVGRRREMYVRGGENVYPMAVEGVLAGHPDVADLAVVGCPDEVMGEIGVAVVVPRDPSRPPDLEDLRAFAGDRLGRHELPERLVLTDSLPLTAMDKVDRAALVRLVARSAPPPTR